MTYNVHTGNLKLNFLNKKYDYMLDMKTHFTSNHFIYKVIAKGHHGRPKYSAVTVLSRKCMLQ